MSLAFKSDILGYVSVLAGAVFAVKETFESLVKRQVDVHFLMLLASIGAIVVGHVEDAAALLFLFSLSGVLEEYAMGRTKDAIGKLIKLRPTTATRVVGDSESEVPVADLTLSDTIRVASYDRFPVDGKVVSGETSVDESALTGESLPVAKQIGDSVSSGTQNLEGGVLIQVTKVAGESTIDRVVALVQEAQENKATGEKLSAWFGQTYTFIVIGAFFASWAIRLALGAPGQDAFYSSLILLVGLSPCALVISTPAATLSALATAARKGILVRGGEYIERAGTIDAIALDKTGTLTKGVLELQALAIFHQDGSITQWQPGDASSPKVTEILGILSGIEANSTHPSARAVIRAGEQAGAKVASVTSAETVAGQGIVGMVNDKKWFVGNEKLLNSNDPTLVEISHDESQAWQQLGRTTVLASNGQERIMLGFADSLRSESATVLGHLKALGIKQTVMLTGDKEKTARAIATNLNIDVVKAGLSPEDKTEYITELGKDHQVMMVGDGVNDAPSLAKASIGVAMGGLGSDVALEAADVVLMQDNLTKIVDLIEIGRRARKIIRANIAISLGMIGILTVASFVVKLPLPIAVLGHEGSTLIVILNGLRLLRSK